MKSRKALRAGKAGASDSSIGDFVTNKLRFKHTQARKSPADVQPAFPQSLLAPTLHVAHWENSSASSLVSPTPRRRKKHISIDISAYQQNGGFPLYSPNLPLSDSAKSPIQLESIDQDDRLKLSIIDPGKPPTLLRNQLQTRLDSEQNRSTGYLERSLLQHCVPDVTAVYAQDWTEEIATRPLYSSSLRRDICPPRLRHKKRLEPQPLLIRKPRSSKSLVDSADKITKPPCTTAGMDQTQMSLSTLDLNRDESSNVPKSAAAQVGIPTFASPQISGSGPTNLSGLVCNVHRTTGQEPHPLVGATTTILGDKLYVFGGRVLSRTRPQLTADLYELDLIRRHWSKLETTGDIPPPRYFHSVCPLGDTKLVCYGGMTPSPLAAQANGNTGAQQQHPDPQPEVVVASDIHVYDVLSQSWTLIPTNSDGPQGRYAHCAAILPSSAMFTSANAPSSAIQHNPSSSNPHSGTLGVKIDGTGGAEMIVVGGQDSSNHYIEQISVFNLRSLKWTATNQLGRSCGAYRSVVAPLTGMTVNDIGRDAASENDSEPSISPSETGSPMLMYSNYNFLDVKLELQIRLPDGRLLERAMSGNVSPPGLRFPNGGVINNHFVVSGTYLTSSKQEYALWALDLRNLSWGRIDAGGTVFGQGSWNRGVLWNRRNTFVILGHRKRSLVDDYNHRRINFSHLCMVELEAFGLYENPKRAAPTSDYVSVSSPPKPKPGQAELEDIQSGGRPFSAAAERLGQSLLEVPEFADMDLVGVDGERIAVNSYLLSKRWGPYFNQLLLHSHTSQDTWSLSDAVTLRPQLISQTSRNSALTITPSIGKSSTHSGTTLTSTSNYSNGLAPSVTQSATRQALNSLEATDSSLVLPGARPRSLYLPHTSQMIRLLVNYLYTSSLPPVTSRLCTPQILCSLLQIARPYQINGLLEATVERLHEVLDGRNAAAVFNASAMAAGGGRGLSHVVDGTLAYLQRRDSAASSNFDESGRLGVVGRIGKGKDGGLRINTEGMTITGSRQPRGHDKADSLDSASTATSFSQTDSDATGHGEEKEREGGPHRDDRPVWAGDMSSVIGLQKRGLRGLMEGKRLRERGNTGSTLGEQGAGAAGRPVGAGHVV